jgi:predicted flap endonuclease-1-like 5' DNA nuclease
VPIFDDVVLEGLDPAVFDVEAGRTMPLDAGGGLAAGEAEALAAAGIDSPAALYAADTEFVKATLGVSDVRAAEIKTEALRSFRRGEAPRGDVASAPVTGIAGVGPVRAGRLAEAGVTTVGQLAEMDTRRVAETLRVSESVAEALVGEARAIVGRS